MGVLLVSVFISLLASSTRQLLCMADDRLVPGQSLSLNQTITSAGERFVLGFFSLGNSTSTSHYLGVWYNNIPQRTVVWIANRGSPLTDSAGSVRIVEDGNVVLLDAEGSIIWSSNVSSNPSNTAVVLMESGNLVLRDGEGNDVWQSFHHPTDTCPPDMELEMDFRTRLGQSLVAWKGEQDPSSGSFSFGIDPKSPLQVVSKDGSGIRWRSRPWDGRQINGAMDSSRSSSFVQLFAVNEKKITMSYSPATPSVLSRLVLDSNGQLNFFSWDDKLKNWTLIISRPSRPCDVYGRCGPFGICDPGVSSLCRCLEGFEPKRKKEWESGNFTGGCARRRALECDGTNMFLRSTGVKLPDKFSILWNTTAAQCEASCRADCQCIAYAYANISGGTVLGSRCLTWAGELMDVARYTSGVAEDLYVRHAASELDTNSAISTTSKRKIWHKILIPALIVGLLLVAILSYIIRRRQKERGDKEAGEELLLFDVGEDGLITCKFSGANDHRGVRIQEVPLLSFTNVMASTDNFADTNKLGQGGFGPVYKGKLPEGQEIAVKRLSAQSRQGLEEFKTEVLLIARLQHKNLVRLLGCCIQSDEKLLIYEYMANKSLDFFLFDPTRSAQLDWRRRYHIIEGIAQGLLYLHKYSRLTIIHRDLKASNILLDAEMNPKISDFGMARIFNSNEPHGKTNRVVGTYGYMSPEYAMKGHFSTKSDVFSFGVLLLEIVSGNRNNGGSHQFPGSLDLLGHAWELWKAGRELELMHPSLADSGPPKEVSRCAHVGLLCVQECAKDRPDMSDVVTMLGSESAALSAPKQPAFYNGGVTKKATTSVNTLTISIMDGR